MDINNPPNPNYPEEYISVGKKVAFDNSYRESIIKQILSKSKNYLF